MALPFFCGDAMPVVFITNPAVSEHYNVPPGERALVTDEAEASFLVNNFHAYSMDGPAIPAAGYVNPKAPKFVKFGSKPAKASKESNA